MVANSALAVVILFIALRLLEKVMDYSSSGDLPWLLFLAWAVFEAVRALPWREKPRLERILRLVNVGLFLAGMVIFLLRGADETAQTIAAVLFAVSLLLGRACAIYRNRRVLSIIGNLLLILLVVGVNIGLGAQMIVCNILSFMIPVIYVIRVAFARINLKALRKVIRKTYAGQIIFGMMLLMITMSVLLPAYEPGIQSFADGLWYCFAVVTTIGFGDITATTGIGRLLSVILGIYGIIVVALVTSIIVNFYTEVKAEKDGQDEKRDEDDAQHDDTSSGEMKS